MQIGERTALWASGGSAGYTAADYPALENCPILLDGIENYAFGVHHDDVEQWRSLTKPWIFLSRYNLNNPTVWSYSHPNIKKGRWFRDGDSGCFCDMVNRYGHFSQTLQVLENYTLNLAAKIDVTKVGHLYYDGLSNSHTVSCLRSDGYFYHRSLVTTGYDGGIIDGIIDSDGIVSFTLVHNAAESIIKVYSKGLKITEFDIVSVYKHQINSSFAIGNGNSNVYGSGENHNSCVDEYYSLKIYDRVLSDDEIASIHAIDKVRFGIS